MRAGKFDITVEQGATFSLAVQPKNQDGTALDLTGATIKAQIKKTYSESSPVASFEFSITSNVITLTMSAENTSLLPVDPASDFQIKPTRFMWFLEVALADRTIRLLEGVCSVIPR